MVLITVLWEPSKDLLVVAPDIFVKHQAGLLKKWVAECGEHAVYILCPVPRYATFRCCDDTNHCTNFSDPFSIPVGGVLSAKLS